MSASQPGGPRESLAAILSVERVGEDAWSASLEDFWGASLGGDLLARAALAAAATSPGLELQSLRASYLRAAPPNAPLSLRVARLGEDGAAASREVRVHLDGLVCHVVARFGPAAAGALHQDLALPAGLPRPDDLPSTLEVARKEGWETYARGPLEFRRVGQVWPGPDDGEALPHVEWMRPRVPLSAEPAVHAAALVFLSDFYSHWAFERRIGRRFAHDRFEPLDQAVWLHRPPRWEGWWLMRAITEVGHAGRALQRREIYTQEGILLASTAQEARVGRS